MISLMVPTLHINGIRESGEILALKSFLHKSDPDVLIITETHLTKVEITKVVLPTYDLVAEKSHVPDEMRMRGGVAIFARQGVACEDISAETRQLEPPLYSCTVMLLLGGVAPGAFKITGLYLTPKPQSAAEKLSRLTERNADTTFQGPRVGHLLVGDLNHPSCESGYRT